MYPSARSRVEVGCPRHCGADCAGLPGARGFSLIELMVGLVISLIGTLAMMAAFASFEGQKRTTTSSDDAQQNGSFSLYELERQVRTAGSGLIQGRNWNLWGCTITAWSNSTKRLPGSAALPAPFTAWPLSTPLPPVNEPAFPVLIASGGTSASSGAVLPDTIGVIGGNPAVRVVKAGVTSVTNATTINLDNTVGIYGGDYLLGVASGSGCVLVKAASTPAANAVTLSAADGPTNGFVGAFTGQPYVFDLGSTPIFSLFGIWNDPANPNTSQLVSFDLLQRGTSGGQILPVADGVVMLKALYGVDDGANGGKAGDDIIDEWVQPTGNWSIQSLTAGTPVAIAAATQIKAVRIAVVARSQLPERVVAKGAGAGNIGGYAGATTLTLFPDLVAVLQYTIAIQSQYRYKVYDTTIPVRDALITKLY